MEKELSNGLEASLPPLSRFIPVKFSRIGGLQEGSALEHRPNSYFSLLARMTDHLDPPSLVQSIGKVLDSV
jgi:hypothetical protein